MRLLVSAFVGALLVISGFLVWQQVGNGPPPEGNSGLLYVRAQGVVNAPAEIAVLRIGVDTLGETPGDALIANSEAMQRVYETLGEMGISEESIETVAVGVQPHEVQNENEPEIWYQDGFAALNEITVEVSDLNVLGEVLNRISTTGATRLEDVNFDLIDDTDYVAQAREVAAQNAYLQALSYASQLNVEVLDAVAVSESPIQSTMGAFGIDDEERFIVTGSRISRSSVVPVASRSVIVSQEVYVLFRTEPSPLSSVD